MVDRRTQIQHLTDSPFRKGLSDMGIRMLTTAFTGVAAGLVVLLGSGQALAEVVQTSQAFENGIAGDGSFSADATATDAGELSVETSAAGGGLSGLPICRCRFRYRWDRPRPRAPRGYSRSSNSPRASTRSRSPSPAPSARASTTAALPPPPPRPRSSGPTRTPTVASRARSPVRVSPTCQAR